MEKQQQNQPKFMTDQQLINELTKTLSSFIQDIQNDLGISDGIIMCSLSRLLGMMIAVAPDDHRPILRKNIDQIFNEVEAAYKESQSEQRKQQAASKGIILGSDQ